MDSTLASLFPVHKIGSDGFEWWVGQIESKKGEDPKKSGRYRVRIIGRHLKDCDKIPSSSLPWANVMMPVTTPFSDGGVTGASVGLDIGNWVIGFYLDNDRQKPIILGSIGHTAGATLVENIEKDPNPGGSCKSFTTFLSPKINPYLHTPLDDSEKRNSTEGTSNATDGSTKVGQAGEIAAAVEGKMPAAFYALFTEATPTNPTGGKVCVEIANPNCGSEQDLKSGLSNIIGEMLAANQDSGGQLGSYLVSKATGKLNDYVDTGRRYINKAIRLVKSFIARLKGEIVKLLRDGVDKLVELLLYKEVATTDALGNVNTGPVNPDLGIEPFQPIVKKESILKTIIDQINNVLSEIGCSMEDLTDKIAQYLTDLLLGFLMDAYSNAACLVDTLVNGIINEILGFIDSTLASILGPLEALLSIVASPLDLIGSIISTVFDLLGISCDGPNASCEKVTKECTDCGTEDKDKDWLDKLIDELEDGPLDTTSYVCDEATEPEPVAETVVDFVGGIFEPETVDTTTQTDTTTTFDDTTVTTDTVSTSNLIKYTCQDVTVTEGEDAEFVIIRSGNVTVASSINVSVRSRTAKVREDFIPKFEGSVIGFAPNETSKRLAFRTFRDGDREGAEQFSIRFTSGVIPEGLVASFPDGRDFTCTINDFTFDDYSPSGRGPYVPPSSTNVGTFTTLPVVADIIPKLPVFTITPERPYYYEGESPVFKIKTRNVNQGELFNYRLEGVTDTDIEGLNVTGSFNVDNKGEATVTFTLAVNNDTVRVDPPGTIALTDEDGNFLYDEDGNVLFNEEEIVTDVPDENETLSLVIEENGARASIVIIGENDNQPEYFITPDKTLVVEGEQVVFTILTSNVEDDTVLNYTLTGDITEDDIEGSLTGSFTIVEGRAIVPITIAKDTTTETVAQILTFSIDDTTASSDVFIAAEDLLDLTTDTTPRQTISVTSDKFSYAPGETVEYTVKTTNIDDGTVFQYSLFGENITPDDVVSQSLFGTFVILDGQAKVYVGISENDFEEQNEIMTFLVTGTNAFADILIESDLEEDPQDPEPPKEKEPCIKTPVAGTPITDERGSIISIPIIEKGCPYNKPPRVIITGAGYGSSAIALLDKDNRVSEIRVTRTGAGYKPNIPTGLACVIDSFTLINPGKDYKTEPVVYINGVPGIAKAVINEAGFVISLQILDRSIKYESLPSVEIIGGGGFGARFIASITCLDSIEELERSGYAKIGTGRYIDCP